MDPWDKRSAAADLSLLSRHPLAPDEKASEEEELTKLHNVRHKDLCHPRYHRCQVRVYALVEKIAVELFTPVSSEPTIRLWAGCGAGSES